MPMVAVVTIWWTNGFNVLLFIAGLRNIPAELYEAAALDGATPRQCFWRVTWPLLWPVRRGPDAPADPAAQDLRPDLPADRGRPFNSSYVLLLLVYREAFQLNNGGYAATIAVRASRAPSASIPAVRVRDPAPSGGLMNIGEPLSKNGSSTVAMRWSLWCLWASPLDGRSITCLIEESVATECGCFFFYQFQLGAYVLLLFKIQPDDLGNLNSIAAALFNVLSSTYSCRMMCAYVIQQRRFLGRGGLSPASCG